MFKQRHSEFTNDRLVGLVMEFVALPGETEWIEFKSNLSDPQKIGEYVSALSNAACLRNEPYGYLIYGVSDGSHEIIGTKLDPWRMKKGNEEFIHWMMNRLEPRTDVEIRKVGIDGKAIVIFIIQAASGRPTRFLHKAYVRVGTIKRPLVDFPNLEKRIWNHSSDVSWETEIALHGIQPDAIGDLLAIERYFEALDKQIPSSQGQIIEALEKDQLIRQRGDSVDITNLGAILFANRLSAYEGLRQKSIRVIIYEGKNRIQAKHEQIGAFGYAVRFEGLIDYIDHQFPHNEIIRGATRKNAKMYPKTAIRELVANALIHQDFYQKGTEVLIEIFTDRIEISNPGKPLIDTLRFIDDPPQSRNEHLADFMRRAGYCERRGSGIDRVIGLVEAWQLPAPDFIAKSNHTKTVLYAYRRFAEMNNEDRIRACYQHSCLKFVSNEKMTNRSLRDRFEISKANYPMVSRIIKDTIETGLIKPNDPESKSKRYASYVPFWA